MKKLLLLLIIPFLSFGQVCLDFCFPGPTSVNQNIIATLDGGATGIFPVFTHNLQDGDVFGFFNAVNPILNPIGFQCVGGFFNSEACPPFQGSNSDVLGNISTPWSNALFDGNNLGFITWFADSFDPNLGVLATNNPNYISNEVYAFVERDGLVYECFVNLLSADGVWADTYVPNSSMYVTSIIVDDQPFPPLPCNGENNEIFGCTDNDACNYNSDATEDDGSCNYPEMPLDTPYSMETLYGYDCEGNCLLPQEMCDCEAVETETVVFFEGCCGWPDPFPNCIYIGFVPEYSYEDCFISYIDSCCQDENGDGLCDGDGAGCTDPTACNFNPSAVQDNGSCDYSSCLCDTVFITDTIYVNNFITDTIYVDIVITEYIDCDTGLPCTSGMAEIIKKSKTDGKLYNLLGQEIFRRDGIYIEGGEIKYRLK